MDHKTVSLADQVFENLENDILSGKYQRGELLTESKLSQSLGVSRTPIREALRRLSQEHIIEETGKGIVVLGISEDDLRDIFFIRLKIEAICAAQAAKNRTEEQLSKLREAVEFQEFYLAKKDPDKIKLMDSRFHETIYQMSGSAVLCDVLIPLHKKIQKYRRASISNTSRAEASVSEHRGIYEAIAAGDGKLTEKLVKQHLENAFEHMFAKK
ncbi:MAG: GntR family transcriptional regulator [Clostridia bacterium]|nr:GntR family transcriptional regulator [Clostridia bacterium]